jgi:4-hydroxythreonine-4-phosphate dehydrogenase
LKGLALSSMSKSPRKKKSPRAGGRPRIAISLGDPSGIGPEVTAAALDSRAARAALTPVVFGDERVWARACRQIGAPDRLRRAASAREAAEAGVPSLVLASELAERDCRPGKPSAAGGRAQLRFFERAVEAVAEGAADGLCTAPLSKAQVNRAGLAFSGHTEYLADRFQARVLMMLAGPVLRVAVHTTHVALRDVPERLSEPEIGVDLDLLHRELRRGFGLSRPRIAVLSLNPHAGEGGLFGDEEARVIAPAIAKARRRGIDASGPHPADGLFPRAARGEYDAVLAMYHDQGLVALKLLHFDDGVNVTLGLPRPRTSPDHGVAYDIAGKGAARPDSMRAALALAARLSAPGGRRPGF